MPSCTFFGHRRITNDITQKLHSSIVELIVNNNVTTFYVGCNGDFDKAVIKELEQLAMLYPITYYVVLAYMPTLKSVQYKNSIYPEGIELTPKRFAIPYRNKWMIKQSDYVITYIENPVGSGAAKFRDIAVKNEKLVIALYP